MDSTRCLRQRRRAAAMVEYALVLTMVVGLGGLAYMLVGLTSERSLSTVAHKIGGPSNAAATASLSPVNRRHRTGKKNASESSSAFGFGLAAFAVPLLAALTLIGFRYGRRRRSGDAAGPQEPTPLPKAFRKGFAEKRLQILRMLSNHAQQRPGDYVEVRDLMTTKLTTVTADMSVEELRELMQDIRVRHLLVVGNGDELLGIISDRDVADRNGTTAGEIMSRTVIAVSPQTPVAQAISAMLSHRFSCVPVVEEGRLRGVVTTSDLIMALQCTLQLLLQCADKSTWDAAMADASEPQRISEEPVN